MPFMITKDHIENIPQPQPTEEQKKKMPHRFRLYDDDGELCSQGISSNDSSFAPLDEYGVDYGCTEIKYLTNGIWETL